MRARTCAALLLAVLFAWPSAAQETRGSIEGVVRDATGAILPGATVEAKSAAGGTLTSVTDNNGVYRFPVVAPGRYEVTATLAGFSQPRSAPVDVLVGQVMKVDVSMSLAGVTETVQVLSESPTIDVRQATVATNITADDISRIPKGRDFQSLVTLAPGANNEARSGGLSIDGASASENKFYLDGIDTTNLRTGVSATPFLTDFISELQVKSSGYAAEFGGATGGVVSIISKSGSNQFRGEGGFYLNNDALNGNLAMNDTAGKVGAPPATPGYWEQRQLRLLLTGENQAETVTYPKDDYSRWDPHFQFGGPLVADKMWFWAGYTPTVEKAERTVTFRSNQQTGTFESTETTQNVVGNVVWQIAQPTRLRLSGQYRPYEREGQLPNPNGTNNPLTVFGITTKAPNNTATASFDWVGFEPRVLQHEGQLPRIRPGGHRDPGRDPLHLHGWLEQHLRDPAQLDQSAGYTNILTNRLISRDKYTRAGWTADTTFFVNAGGQHTFKGGIQFERIGNDVADVEQQPNVSLGWDIPSQPRRHRAARCLRLLLLAARSARSAR